MSQSKEKKVELLNIIPSLETGGAEMLLVELSSRLEQSKIKSTIVTLKSHKAASVTGKLKNTEVINLEIDNPRKIIPSLIELYRIIRSRKPDVIHCWMYHANLIGGIFGHFLDVKNIIWSIHSNLPDTTKISTRIINKFLILLSKRIPSSIIFVSQASLNKHIKFGYPGNKSLIINNGIDHNLIKFSSEKGSSLKKSLDIKSEALVVGTIGRFVKEKDYPNFINAIKSIKSDRALEIVMAGNGIDESNPLFRDLIYTHALSSKFHLMGNIANVTDFYSAIDILVISSLSESAPVSLMEAMSCEVVCISTNVGDCALILNNPLLIVEPRNSEKLGEKIQEIINLSNDEKNLIKKELRRRIVNHYSLNAMEQNYIKIYSGI